MSHASVLVIGDDIDVLMEPYYEELQVPDYRFYVVLNDEYLKFLKEILTPYGWDGNLDNKEKLITAYNAHYPDDTPWLLDNQGIYYNSNYNPDSKWDWYQVGGRWSGLCTVKDGYYEQRGELSWATKDFVYENSKADQALFDAIDWHAMKHTQRTALKDNWENAWQPEVPEKERYDSIFGYGIPQGYSAGDFDLYWDDHFGNMPYCLTTYALLDEDGWHEPGQLGWFGSTDATESSTEQFKSWYQQRLSDCAPNDLLTIIDYHI